MFRAISASQMPGLPHLCSSSAGSVMTSCTCFGITHLLAFMTGLTMIHEHQDMRTSKAVALTY
jgi:hypothetical protein